MTTLLAVACGGPTGEAVCQDFQRTIAQHQAREIGLFEFHERIQRLKDQSQEAEPELTQAASHLAYSVTTVSPERVEVDISSMWDACVKAGYLQLGPLNPTDG